MIIFKAQIIFSFHFASAKSLYLIDFRIVRCLWLNCLFIHYSFTFVYLVKWLMNEWWTMKPATSNSVQIVPAKMIWDWSVFLSWYVFLLYLLCSIIYANVVKSRNNYCIDLAVSNRQIILWINTALISGKNWEFLRNLWIRISCGCSGE